LLTLSLSLLSLVNRCHHSFRPVTFHFHIYSLFSVRENWEKERIVTLMCIDAVEKKYQENEHDANRDPSEEYFAYKRYMANNGVKPLMMRREQADYLDTFSKDA
jgi:hypothetical protein